MKTRRDLLQIATMSTLAMLRLPAQVMGQSAANDSGTRQQHIAWVSESLKQMQTVKAGMTRQELRRVFTTEGGGSNGLRRRYVFSQCPYFKVDVEFEPVGRPARDADGRVTLIESDRDIISKISKPYIEFSVMD